MTDTEDARDTRVEPGAVALADAKPLDNALARDTRPFRTVVVDASAGGVETLMRFFESMPPSTGCAFLVVSGRSSRTSRRTTRGRASTESLVR